MGRQNITVIQILTLVALFSTASFKKAIYHIIDKRMIHLNYNLLTVRLPLLLSICLLVLLSSCVSHDELLNFSQGKFIEGNAPPPPPMIIQVDDLLAIKVRTLDVEASLPFNLDEGNINLAVAGVGRPIIGYIVDYEGNVDIPVIGKQKAAGLTVPELKENIKKALTSYLVQPVVNIRFVNFRITLTGEVKSPGSYIMPNERVTILDALGMAGDLTPYANRTNILIVREQNGQREFGRINVHDKAIFESPYFYLRQNDFIYIEPLPEATASVRDQSQRILPWVGLVTSVVTLTLTLSRK